MHAAENATLWCGIPWVDPQCTFYFGAALTPPEGAAPTDWELCVQTNEDDTCSEAVLTVRCTGPADWSDATGAYDIVLSWEGVCVQVDDRLFRAVVRRAAGATVSDCREYLATFSFIYVDEICTPG